MISLLCDVQAYPPADIIWTKDGQVLEFTSGMHILPGDLLSKYNSGFIMTLREAYVQYVWF